MPKPKWTEEDLKKAVGESNSFSEVARKLYTCTSNFKTIKTYIDRLKLDVSHFLLIKAAKNKGINIKFCSKCKTNKSISKFNKCKNNYSSYCTVCQREYDKIHYKNNKERYLCIKNKHKRERIKKYRQKIKDIKNVPCMDCKEKHPCWAMDFDHRDPGDKKFNISNGACRYSWDNIKQEIDKCDIVCALCHRYRTYGSKRYRRK